MSSSVSVSALRTQPEPSIPVHEIFWDGGRLREALSLQKVDATISRAEWNIANTDNPDLTSILQDARQTYRTVSVAYEHAKATKATCDDVSARKTGTEAEKAAREAALLATWLGPAGHILQKLESIHPNGRSTGVYPDDSRGSVRTMYGDMTDRAADHHISPDEIAKTAEILRFAQRSLADTAPQPELAYQTMSRSSEFTKKNSKGSIVKTYFKDRDDLDKAISTAYERLEVAYQKVTGVALGAVLDAWKEARSGASGQGSVDSEAIELPSEPDDGASIITVIPRGVKKRASQVIPKLKQLIRRQG